MKYMHGIAWNYGEVRPRTLKPANTFRQKGKHFFLAPPIGHNTLFYFKGYGDTVNQYSGICFGIYLPRPLNYLHVKFCRSARAKPTDYSCRTHGSTLRCKGDEVKRRKTS